MPTARPRLITLRLHRERYAKLKAAADHAGIDVETWLLEAADLALLRGSTR